MAESNQPNDKTKPTRSAASKTPPKKKGKGDKPKRRGGCLRGCFIITLFLLFAGLGASFGIIYTLDKRLPSLTALENYRPQLVNRMFARNDERVAELFQEKRDLVSLDEVPQNLVHALLATEDARFYQHPGIDVIRIMGALVADIKARKVVEGGSTITQQLARNLFTGAQKTVERKLEEISLAFRIEQHYTKREILEMYMNQVYLGHGTFGFKAAAEFYYRKDIKDLTLAESASLVGLLKAPGNYSPVNNAEASRKRRNTVLSRMLIEEYIDQQTYETACQEPMPEPSERHKRVQQEMLYPYFVETVRRILLNVDKLPDPPIDPKEYQLGGLHIQTTMDPEYQRIAEEAVKTGLKGVEQLRRKYRYGWGDPDTPFQKGRTLKEGEVYDAKIISVSGNHLKFEIPEVGSDRHEMDVNLDDTWLDDFEVLKPQYYFRVSAVEKKGKTWTFVQEWEPHVQAALAAMDPKSGEVRALVGGYDFFEKDAKQNVQLIRAVQTSRQPGSGFKPIIYSTALSEGYTPATLLSDEQITFTYGKQSWSPKNYHDRYYSLIPLSTALEESQNCATVRLLQAISVGKVQQMTQKLGFTSPLPSDMSVALGTAEVSPLEMVVAYAAFANGGHRVKPNVISKITDRNGKELYANRPIVYPALRPEVAFQMANILKGVIQHGTGWKAKDIKYPIAGKTGTTNKCEEAWFTGFSPHIVVSVYVGFDEKRSLGDKMTGSACALPIWKSFMEQALPLIAKEINPENPPKPEEMDFEMPPGMVWASVCRYSGQLATPNCTGVKQPFLPGTEPKTYCAQHATGATSEPGSATAGQEGL